MKKKGKFGLASRRRMWNLLLQLFLEEMLCRIVAVIFYCGSKAWRGVRPDLARGGKKKERKKKAKQNRKQQGQGKMKRSNYPLCVE